MLPGFETPRLLLRPRTLADTDDCIAMNRDPGVVRFVDGPWSGPATHRAFVEARTRGPYPAGLGALGLPGIVADIDPANAASARVAEKIGMRPFGSRCYPGEGRHLGWRRAPPAVALVAAAAAARSTVALAR